EERQGVVLAEGEEVDRPLDDLAQTAVRAVPALGREGGQEVRVPLVAGRGLEERLEEAFRRAVGAGRAEVHAKRRADLGDIALVALPDVWRDLPAQQPVPKVRGFDAAQERGRPRATA